MTINREQAIALAREAHGPITDNWLDMDYAALERLCNLAVEFAQKDVAPVAWFAECPNEESEYLNYDEQSVVIFDKEQLAWEEYEGWKVTPLYPHLAHDDTALDLAVAHEAKDLALVQNLLAEYGLQALDVVKTFKEAQKAAEPVAWMNPMNEVVISKYQKTQAGLGDGYPKFSVPVYLHPSNDDTALLRQCLEGYESMIGRKPERIENLITALRRRLEKL